MSKNAKIAALIIGLLLSAVLVAVAFLIFQGRFSKAAAEISNMAVTVTGNTKALITWNTEVAPPEGEHFSVYYGSSPTSTNLIVEAVDEGTKHSATLIGLAPDTDYFYHLEFGGNKITNAGVDWNFSTLADQKSKTTSDLETVISSPSPTAAIVKNLEPTPTSAAAYPTIDKGAMKETIRAEYKCWDEETISSCTKKYSGNLCAYSLRDVPCE